MSFVTSHKALVPLSIKHEFGLVCLVVQLAMYYLFLDMRMYHFLGYTFLDNEQLTDIEPFYFTILFLFHHSIIPSNLIQKCATDN